MYCTAHAMLVHASNSRDVLHAIVMLQILSDDYSKAAFLCQDRSIHFHAKFGQYYSTRVPSFGRDLAYAPFSADLLVVGSAPEVYRCVASFWYMSCMHNAAILVRTFMKGKEGKGSKAQQWEKVSGEMAVGKVAVEKWQWGRFQRGNGNGQKTLGKRQ